MGANEVGSNEEKVAFADYVVRAVRSSDDEGCLEVQKANVVVYSERKAMQYRIGNNVNAENLKGYPLIPEIKAGTDITGNLIPNLIVSAWTGGAHCCFSFIVLELGKIFKVASRIEAEHSDLAHFEDIKHDGRYVFVGNDWAFAYWHTDFGQSPAPTVILRPEKDSDGDTQYKLALDLMRKPVPTDKQFAAAVQKIRADKAWRSENVPPQLWGQMANFIYSGHPTLAWKLLDQAWPKEKSGKRGFLGAFCDRLENSHYWYGGISDLLKNAPADCFSVN
jgi:hypothetical protein